MTSQGVLIVDVIGDACAEATKQKHTKSLFQPMCIVCLLLFEKRNRYKLNSKRNYSHLDQI